MGVIGFVIVEPALPGCLSVTHRCLFSCIVRVARQGNARLENETIVASLSLGTKLHGTTKRMQDGAVCISFVDKRNEGKQTADRA